MAQIISGKEVALKVRERIKNEVEELLTKTGRERRVWLLWHVCTPRKAGR